MYPNSMLQMLGLGGMPGGANAPGLAEQRRLIRQMEEEMQRRRADQQRYGGKIADTELLQRELERRRADAEALQAYEARAGQQAQLREELKAVRAARQGPAVAESPPDADLADRIRRLRDQAATGVPDPQSGDVRDLLLRGPAPKPQAIGTYDPRTPPAMQLLGGSAPSGAWGPRRVPRSNVTPISQDDGRDRLDLLDDRVRGSAGPQPAVAESKAHQDARVAMGLPPDGVMPGLGPMRHPSASGPLPYGATTPVGPSGMSRADRMAQLHQAMQQRQAAQQADPRQAQSQAQRAAIRDELRRRGIDRNTLQMEDRRSQIVGQGNDPLDARYQREKAIADGLTQRYQDAIGGGNSRSSGFGQPDDFQSQLAGNDLTTPAGLRRLPPGGLSGHPSSLNQSHDYAAIDAAQDGRTRAMWAALGLDSPNDRVSLDEHMGRHYGNRSSITQGSTGGLHSQPTVRLESGRARQARELRELADSGAGRQVRYDDRGRQIVSYPGLTPDAARHRADEIDRQIDADQSAGSLRSLARQNMGLARRLGILGESVVTPNMVQEAMAKGDPKAVEAIRQKLAEQRAGHQDHVDDRRRVAGMMREIDPLIGSPGTRYTLQKQAAERAAIAQGLQAMRQQAQQQQVLASLPPEDRRAMMQTLATVAGNDRAAWLDAQSAGMDRQALLDRLLMEQQGNRLEGQLNRKSNETIAGMDLTRDQRRAIEEQYNHLLEPTYRHFINQGYDHSQAQAKAIAEVGAAKARALGGLGGGPAGGPVGGSVIPAPGAGGSGSTGGPGAAGVGAPAPGPQGGAVDVVEQVNAMFPGPFVSAEDFYNRTASMTAAQRKEAFDTLKRLHDAGVKEIDVAAFEDDLKHNLNPPDEGKWYKDIFPGNDDLFRHFGPHDISDKPYRAAHESDADFAKRLAKINAKRFLFGLPAISEPVDATKLSPWQGGPWPWQGGQWFWE